MTTELQTSPTLPHQPLTHAGSIELLNAVVEGVLEYLATVADPASERLGNALRLANGLVFETLPSEYAEVWA